MCFFSGIERGSRPRPTTVVASSVKSALDRSTHAHDLLNHFAGSTPTASSSASRPSSRGTKTSFSVSTSSCQRCAVARPRSALGRLETLSRSPSPIHLAASRDSHVRGTLLEIRSLASPPGSDPDHHSPSFFACCDTPRVFFFWSRLLALRLFLPREARTIPRTSTDVALPRRVLQSRVTRSASRTLSARSARRLSAPRRRRAVPPRSPRWSLSTPSPT